MENLEYALSIYDPFDGFNPFDVMEDQEKYDHTDPEKSAAQIIKGAIFSPVGEFLQNSLYNSMSKHKGDPEDYMRFFDSGPTQDAINLIMSGGLSPAEMAELDMDAFDAMNVGEVHRHRLLPEPDHELFELHKTVNPAKHPDNWIDLAHIFDPRTETLYINWAPTHGKGLNGAAIGDIYTKALTDEAVFKYNKHGGKVAKPFQDVYEVTRKKVIELMGETNPYNIVLTGHSQGASIATMASADEIFANKHITTYAVGPGVVGDRKFMDGLKNNIGTGSLDYNRITHKKDPISYLGNFQHYSDEIWDISNDMIDPYKLMKEVEEVGFRHGYGLDNLNRVAANAQGAVMHFFGATHCASGLIDSTNLIRRGEGIPAGVAKGADVYKGLKGSVIRIWHNIATATLYDVFILGKHLVEKGLAKGLPYLKKILPTLGQKMITSIEKVLTKAGYDVNIGKYVENLNTRGTLKRFGSKVFNHFKVTNAAVFNSMTTNMSEFEQAKFFDYIDDSTRYADFEDFTAGGKPLVSAASPDMIELLHKSDFGDVDIGGYQTLGDTDFENVKFKSKFLNNTHDLYKRSTNKVVKRAKGVGQQVGIAMDAGKGVFQDTGDIMRKQFLAAVEKFNLNRAKMMKQYLDTVYNGYYYTELDDFPKPTVLNNTRLGKFTTQVGDFIKQKGMKIIETNILGVSGIGKYKKGFGEVGEKGTKASIEFLQQLLKKSATYGRKGKKFMKKIAKYIYKEVPILSPALEIGFTALEISNDLERIESEKDHIIWNGQVVFRAYNPTEYAQLVMLNLVYEMNDLGDVSFDEFTNTWYGRLSSDDDGVLSIDGVPTDDPDFDIVYEKSIIKTRDRSDYSGESKTLSVLKNVGLGVFNLALDLSTFGAGNAGAAGSIAIGVIDELFEQGAISDRESGFQKAFKVKMFNDAFGTLVDTIMRRDGREKVPGEKVSMTTMYSNSVRFLMTKYFRLRYLKHMEDFEDMSEEDMDAQMADALKHLVANGFSEEVLKDGGDHFERMSDFYEYEPNQFTEMAQVFVTMPGITAAHLGSMMVSTAVSFAMGLEGIMRTAGMVVDKYKEALALSGDILDNYYKSLKNDKTTFYNKAFKDRVTQMKFAYFENKNQLKQSFKDKVISLELYQAMEYNMTENWIMDLKLVDAIANRNSKHRHDPFIKELLEKNENEQLQKAISKNISINESLAGLMEKHSNVGTSGDLQGDMDMDILKSTLEYLLSISGNEGNEELKSFLLTRFTKEVFDKDEGDARNNATSGASYGIFKMGRLSNPTLSEEDLAYLKTFGITSSDLDMLNETSETSVSLNIENSIREQYEKITRVMDVFHDGRSQYRHDADIIEYYKEMGIEIDPNVRTENRITSIKEQLGADYEAIIAQMMADFKAMIESGEFNPDFPDSPQQQFENILFDYRQQRTLDEEAPNLFAGNQNDVLSEVEQFDKGYADEEGEPRDVFTPTGKILPFTINNGVPKMLFEDKSEASYTGPKNALVGNINIGYWIGPIPRGDHAPINIIDNFYMAFHIEHQRDPLIARLRFMSRITKALNTKTITVEKGLVEYNIAIATLNFLEENNDIYGMDIDSVLMNDGLGAELRMQLLETTNGVRKGALPTDFKMPKDGVELELNVENPLKRAADLAFELGDEMMGQKFRKISRERDDMERVAEEYLNEIRKLNNKEQPSINPLQRLVTDGAFRQEPIQEKYTQLLIASLDQKLISLI